MGIREEAAVSDTGETAFSRIRSFLPAEDRRERPMRPDRKRRNTGRQSGQGKYLDQGCFFFDILMVSSTL